MKKRLGKNSAMMTVELGVSLVLIIVVLFVVIGLFNDNIKSMIGSSNFSRVFSANGLKNFFQSFNRNYDDSQIYVQIMGEQGLEVLRQKANNGDEKLISAAQITGQSTTPQTVNTILYLARVIRIIVGDQYICNPIQTPSTKLCVALGGIKYEVLDNGSTITIKDSSGYSLNLTVTKQVTMPTISPTATAKEKIAAIQQLAAAYGADINSNYALTKEITNFTTAMQNAGATNNIETELVNLLGKQGAAGTESLYALLDASKTACVGVLMDPSCDPSVDAAELSAYNTLVTGIIKQMDDLMNSTTYTGTPSVSSTSSMVYLPSTKLPPAYKPTINADDNWYSANAAAETIVEGSEDALVMTLSKNDPLALLAPEGEDPILQGSSDAYYNCMAGAPDEAECSDCFAAGGVWGATCVCPSGGFWQAPDCYVKGTCPSGYTWNGTTCVVSSGPSSCAPGTVPYGASCVTCASGVLDDLGVCCGTGIVTSNGDCTPTTVCTATSASTISCGSSVVTVVPPITGNPVTVTYTSGVSDVSYSSVTASFDGTFISGTKYMTDYYMSKLATTDRTPAVLTKMLTIYNDLFLTVMKKRIDRGSLGAWSIGKFLGQDAKKNSCTVFKTGMMKIAQNHGLKSMYDDLNSASNKTLCPVN